MIWCPRGREAWSLVAGMALGRIGALIKPHQVTVLWYADAGDDVGALPSSAVRERIAARARAAVPGSRVTVHPVGWIEEAEADLTLLAQQRR